jgi:NTE family protein
MRRLIVFITLIAAYIVSGNSLADVDASPEQRARIALVLSGGGARGLAHIGVLKVLEEMRVPIDCVVGTSMGALVGGIYASGISPNAMEQAIVKNDLGALFDDLPPRSEIAYRIKRDDHKPLFNFTLGYNNGEVQLPTGASAGYKFELFLKEVIGLGASAAGLNFDSLPIPYRAVATDLESGEMAVFSQGELAKVMRASMSLPAILAPTEIDDRIYVDGGLVRNLPVQIGRELCGDLVIAVNVGTPAMKREEIHTVIDVAIQSINLLTEQNVRASLKQLKAGDILIKPDLEGFASSDFNAKGSIIERGGVAAEDRMESLADLALSQSEYAQWLALRQSRMKPTPVIDHIAIVTDGKVGADAVAQDLTVQPGEAFSQALLGRDLTRIYGRGDFSLVGYRLVPDGESYTLEIEAESKPWGPGYLKFGFGAISDFNSPAQLNLAASYRRTWVNDLGAEWRTDLQFGYESLFHTEFLQPLQVRDGAFIAPYFKMQRKLVQFYLQDLHIGQHEVTSSRLGLDLGLTGEAGELRIGPFIGKVETQPDFGIATSLVPAESVKQVGLEISAVIDQLDSLTFPRSGILARFHLRATDKDWGSEDEYSRVQLTFNGFKSFGKSTFSTGVEWGDDFAGSTPIYDPFKLGGPRRLSGLYLDQLSGTRYNLANLGYFYQYARLPSQLGRGAYLGLSLEAGRIDDPLMQDPWDWVKAGGVYWGADTVLGALVIGFGVSSIGQESFYMMIAPHF